MGWRRETWVLLVWFALTVGGVILVVGTRPAIGPGIAECGPALGYGHPFGPCGDALVTIGLLGVVLLVGGVGLLLASIRWLRSRDRS